jgi:hypothetical protein
LNDTGKKGPSQKESKKQPESELSKFDFSQHLQKLKEELNKINDEDEEEDEESDESFHGNHCIDFLI